MKIFYVERKNILSRTCFNCSAVFKLSQEQDVHNFLYSVLISLVLYWDMLETMILLFCELLLSAVSKLAVAVAHYLGARCCCLPSVHSISCRWPHHHQGRHLWHQPSHIYNLVTRCVEAHETFVNCHFSNHTFDVIYSPSVVHILSPCCTFMNSWQFTSISSEKKICVNSTT